MIIKLLPLVFISFFIFLAPCSRNQTTHKDKEALPLPADKKETTAAADSAKQPEGPIAGSVWDVAHGDGRLPPDIKEAMKEYGADAKLADKFWHRQLIDINGDGSKELMLSNVLEWCGSGGCGVWLWQRTPEGLRNLLPTEKIVAVAVVVEPATSSGYHHLRFYHRRFNADEKPALVSDLYVWSQGGYHYRSTQQHGQYLDSSLPPNAWRTGL